MITQKETEKISRINELFYELVQSLKAQKFDFCAYVVEDAYRFFMTSIENRYPK